MNIERILKYVPKGYKCGPTWLKSRFRSILELECERKHVRFPRSYGLSHRVAIGTASRGIVRMISLKVR